MNRERMYATLAGFGSILLWSCSISFTRVVAENLGPFSTGAAGYLIAGVIGTAILLARPASRAALKKGRLLPTLVCGGLFIVYAVCLLSAIGLASGRKQTLEVGVINYLWPAMTLVLSIPLLGSRPRAALRVGRMSVPSGTVLTVGIMLALSGAVLAVAAKEGLTWGGFQADLRANAWPYLLSLVNAVTWAFYSNLTRRWVGQVPAGMVAILMLLSGLLMAALALGSGESPRWTAPTAAFLIAQAIGPYLIAYFFWETAMRVGNVTVVASAAYLTPVLSLIVSCFVLGKDLADARLWLGSALVVVGAVLCKLTIQERAETHL